MRKHSREKDKEGHMKQKDEILQSAIYAAIRKIAQYKMSIYDKEDKYAF